MTIAFESLPPTGIFLFHDATRMPALRQSGRTSTNSLAAMRYTLSMPGPEIAPQKLLKRAFPEIRNNREFRIAEDDGE